MADRKRKRSTQPHHSQPQVAQGSHVRFEEPNSTRGQKPMSKRMVIVREINPAAGFLDFLREHTVVSLAVGFAIATQAQTVIKQLIASFIDPLYGLLFGNKLSDKIVTLHLRGREQQFAWGAFVYTFIDFLFVLLAIYIVIKAFKLDKLDTVKDEDEVN